MKKYVFPVCIYILLGIALFYIAIFVVNKMGILKQLPWIDIPEHILGGFLVSGMFVYFFKLIKYELRFSKILSFIFVTMVGGTWEIIEAPVWIGPGWEGWREAFKDMFFNIIGMALFRYSQKFRY